VDLAITGDPGDDEVLVSAPCDPDIDLAAVRATVGGDVRVRRGEPGTGGEGATPRIEVRLSVRGTHGEEVVRPVDCGTWPAGDVVVDLHGTSLSPTAFLALLDRAGNHSGAVAFRNVPRGLRLLTEASGRGAELPMRGPAGPRLPELLVELWS